MAHGRNGAVIQARPQRSYCLPVQRVAKRRLFNNTLLQDL